jgi:hypothetical protein
MNKSQNEEGKLIDEVPKRQGLLFQVEHLEGTNVWAVVQLGDLDEILTKARLWDNHELQVGIGDRICYLKHYGKERRVL